MLKLLIDEDIKNVIYPHPLSQFNRLYFRANDKTSITMLYYRME